MMPTDKQSAERARAEEAAQYLADKGLVGKGITYTNMAEFAALAVEREREACAKAVCVYCKGGEFKRDDNCHRTDEGMFLDMCKAAAIWGRA